jgi:hypothetical protein
MKSCVCPAAVDDVTVTGWPCWMEVSCAAIKVIVWAGSGPELVYVAPLAGGLVRSDVGTQTVCE